MIYLRIDRKNILDIDSMLIEIPVRALKFEDVQGLLSTSRYVVRINDYPILLKYTENLTEYQMLKL